MARIDAYAKEHDLTREEVIDRLRAEAKPRGDAAVDRSLQGLARVPDWAWYAFGGLPGVALGGAARHFARRRGSRDNDQRSNYRAAATSPPVLGLRSSARTTRHRRSGVQRGRSPASRSLACLHRRILH